MSKRKAAEVNEDKIIRDIKSGELSSRQIANIHKVDIGTVHKIAKTHDLKIRNVVTKEKTPTIKDKIAFCKELIFYSGDMQKAAKSLKDKNITLPDEICIYEPHYSMIPDDFSANNSKTYKALLAIMVYHPNDRNELYEIFKDKEFMNSELSVLDSRNFASKIDNLKYRKIIDDNYLPSLKPKKINRKSLTVEQINLMIEADIEGLTLSETADIFGCSPMFISLFKKSDSYIALKRQYLKDHNLTENDNIYKLQRMLSELESAIKDKEDELAELKQKANDISRKINICMNEQI